VRRFLLRSAVIPVVAVVALSASSSALADNASATGQAHRSKRVCSATPAPMTAACDSHVRTKDDGVTPSATTTYQAGYTPAQLQTAYKVLAGGGAGTLVAIVDAYANPNAASDLAAYRSTFKLPPATFSEIAQDGQGIGTVSGNVGWGQEEALDLDMVSAMCPACKIVYVGARSASYADLGAAVKYAHDVLGAKVISNSYGGSEFSSEPTYSANYYSYRDAVVTVSSGDSGYGSQFPAASNTVVAVGGTTLRLNADSTRSSETVWSKGGSGCSAYMAKPTAWQKDNLCGRRTIADVAAVGDPNTGVAVYDSYGSSNGANWMVFGGTSVAAPLVGAYYAASGVAQTFSATSYPVAFTYAHAGSLFDVTSGSNGNCGRSKSSAYYLCHARAGYDGPTGLGTPNGQAAF
jgi:subtilase family serine protease